MKLFWRYLKQQTWLIALPLLLMTAYGATALAAQAPSFSATASGATNNLTLTANMNVGDADLGKNGNTYLGFNFNQAWYFNNGAQWVRFASGALPIYAAAAPLANRSIEVVRNADLSGLVGGQLYVGYGLSESDMLANAKYGMVYTVVADTTAPTVSATAIANGATGVAINTTVGATLSEAMNPASITTATVTLRQGATPVLGTVSYSGTSVVFVPSSPLASSTGYTATIKGGSSGVKDLAGNALASDYVWSFTTGAAADTTAPTVSGTVIANGATGVAINTTVGATLSEAMNPASITTATVTLRQGATPVLGTVSYSGTSVVFVPSSPLANSTGYTATIKGGSSGVKDLAGNALASDFVWNFTTAGSAGPAGPAAVNLLTAGNFAILAKTTITDIPSSAITGNIGLSPAAGASIGVTCAEMTGTIYTVDATYVGSGNVTCVAPGPGANKTLVDNAILDMGTAYGDAAGRTLPNATELGAGNISGLTIAPGLYKWSTGVAINTDVYLSGGANDVWIFQIAGDLSIAAGGSVPAGIKVVLSGGAQAKNIFWQVGGPTGATLGTYSTFNGNILSAKQVIFRTGAVLNGRAFADSQVVLDRNTVTKPAP